LEERLCKAIYSEENDVTFESETIEVTSLEEILELDKRYGKMEPRNGKYFTFRVMDWSSKTITNKQIVKAVTLAWHQAEIEIDIDVRKAKDDEEADFKIFFRKTEDDPLLTSSTIMYHYYPIRQLDSPLRGVCVVNTDFNYTMNGLPVSMHLIDEDHYDEDTKAKGTTIDFDGVYTHEGPGHGLGLSHLKNKFNLMYPNYSYMLEFIASENPKYTIPRLIAKYSVRPMLSRWRIRWRNWYRARAENY